MICEACENDQADCACPPVHWLLVLGDRLEAFHERAAMREYHGGYGRAQAERLAFRDATGRWAPLGQTVQQNLL